MGAFIGATGRAARFAALSAIMLSGCQIGFPDATDTGSDAQKRLPDVSRVAGARAYVKAARDSIVAQENWVRTADEASDLGVLGGGIVALMGGLLHWNSKNVIKGGVVAAGSLAANYALSPKAQLAVLDKGLDALNCVDGQAEAGFAVVGKLDSRLQPIRAAIGNLRAATADARARYPQALTVSTPEPLADLLKTIDNNAVYADRMDLYVVGEDLPVTTAGESVRVATDAVIQATNEQLHTLLPDGDAIKQALAQASAAIPGASPATGNAPSQPTPVGPSTAPNSSQEAQDFITNGHFDQLLGLTGDAAKAKTDQIAADIKAKIKDIEDKAAAVTNAVTAFEQQEKQDPTPASNMNFSSCSVAQTALKADVASIAASLNQSFTFHVSGGPSQVSWLGSQPPGNATLNQTYSFSNPATYTVKTDTATGDGKYALVITGAGSSITLQFTAK